MRRAAVTALLVLPLSTAAAQTTARLNGYWEHQLSVGFSGDKWTQIDYDRFRADLSARAGRSTQASVALIYQLYRGNTGISLNDRLPDEYQSPLLDSVLFELEDRHYLNHAYITIKPGPFEITTGKQYLTWGAAWVFNPTELFRPKNAFEPTYEREGVGALSLKLPLGALSDVMAAYVPDGGFETSGKVFRARHHFGGFDISATAAQIHETPPSLGVGATEPIPERRYTMGGDVTGELLGLGVWIEGTWSDRGDRNWVEATVGTNYTLHDGTLLLAEAYYNGRGEWDAPYPITSWLARLSGDGLTLGRLTVYGSASRRFGELWTVAASSIVNVGDGSAALIPAITYGFAENVDLVMNLVFPLGADGTEWGSGGYGGFIRGRVYF